ncbi:hypothetical protein GTA08_BOTSDO13979 [Botryosphaeria dothidea]|uniref:Reverse transcriptase/retrotransposon-derived protein RNase H-like domain-containing protein n=1 Tax=Botryosphaeria dothidea TaxID=55169 RepID=A0A8H4N641_9PEZI|nr:hypothetical protein GTA08_BOTSDO13979 [Botryosphaeria dothidea]
MSRDELLVLRKTLNELLDKGFIRDFLDDFVSAYVDNILIFTDGSRRAYREKVNKVLEKLDTTGYIIEVGKGIRIDPEKIKAIQEWNIPTTAKGVLGFLGFANFYRRFIKGFSNLNQETELAFGKLKKAFITAPVLMQFDPERETILATDSLGYCIGGVLQQYDDDGFLRPVAFFSKKNLPAECNYPIYDKELLAVVKCLRQWDAELRGLHQFKILTDHKNLEYFTTARRLPRGRFDGKTNGLADALTRRDQDLPTTDKDERLERRTAQLFQPMANGLVLNTGSPEDPEEQGDWDNEGLLLSEEATTTQPRQARPGQQAREPPSLEDQWQEALQQDQVLRQLREAV